jgi:N-hydroxyarylamine O-acetyltransferase
MDIPAYLERIRYSGPLEPGYAALRNLHQAHLLAVPFENLDIHLGRPITLDLERIFDKIVRQRRGGFCYELNGLFAALLSGLGFQVKLLSASDAHADGSFSPEFDHLTLQVSAPGAPAGGWLADVGWGDTFRQPLQLAKNGEQSPDGRAYRLEPVGQYLLLWQQATAGSWERQYRFTLQPRRFADFAAMCRYHQTSPESLFTRKRICTLATPEGRITLEETRLITTTHGQRLEQPVEDEEARQRILRQRFGIEL